MVMVGIRARENARSRSFNACAKSGFARQRALRSLRAVARLLRYAPELAAYCVITSLCASCPVIS